MKISNANQAVEAKDRARSDMQLARNTGGNWSVFVLAQMMFLAPALGVPSEEMLQDTLKSAIVAGGTLISWLIYLWHQRRHGAHMFSHWVLYLPLSLAVFAVASTVWSHTYLATVEATRWLVFTLLLWIGINTLTIERANRLFMGLHVGATIASAWVALQFWFDFKYFPQGAVPASTFVNRNFFAEFAISALPLSVLLLARSNTISGAYLLGLTTAFNVVALMMTGTRSALFVLVLLGPITAFVLIRYRNSFRWENWNLRETMGVPMTAFFTLLVAGAVPTGNSLLIAEFGRVNAIEHASARIASISKDVDSGGGSFSGSLAIRTALWRATGEMIEAHPLVGVGAGAWEVEAPLYQRKGSQIEVDFYAHNEPLQLVAEYGLLGWFFLFALAVYLISGALRTLRLSPEQEVEAPLRAFALLSLFALLVVSNAGFPWRLAPTGALFALCLAVLAASDLRLSADRLKPTPLLDLKPGALHAVLAFFVALLFLAAFVTQQAAEAERKLVRAVKLALTITQSGRPNHPYWEPAKAEMLSLAREGVAINPHYRKLTPMVADEAASWGDWQTAIEIWKPILASRPNVVAVAANISRGYFHLGDYARSQEYLDRAARIQPTAPAVRTVQVLLLVQNAKYKEAAVLVKSLFEANTFDYELVYAGYLAGIRSANWELAIQALEIRIRAWPGEASDGWLKLAEIYTRPDALDEIKAFHSYQQGLKFSSPESREAVLGKIPPRYKEKLPTSP